MITVATNPVFGTDDPGYSPETTVSGPTVVTGTALVVVEGDGTVSYRETVRDEYWDVDPITGSDDVIVSTVVNSPESLDCTNCVRQRIEQIDPETGARTVLYSEVTPGRRNTEWHDVDRINETHYLVADIVQQEVEIVDTSTDTTTWEWSAYTTLAPDSGGSFTGDWTHLNDVELVRDGRYVTASLRNHDRVIFVNRSSGRVNESLSLGADDAHSTLYEQHNADYVPEERGGPALIVADSNNDRIVEFQRVDGTWTESWVWRDERLKWPRDADRLPNGHTLVTDTNGNRVLQIDTRGTVVWSISTAIDVYEAERLSTPDESANGEAAVELGLRSRTADPETPVEHAQSRVESVLGPRIVNGLVWVTPRWMRIPESFTLLVSVLSALVLAGYELAGRCSAARRRLSSLRDDD
ncbi:aryl sulfotransferase [Halobaculum sp. MBLA0147]|uniref:aryl sulfotransferase n=1 Tax=Halobaculum sp. MBLA0147 TaxID=3079934 RepID=UPI00352589D8